VREDSEQRWFVEAAACPGSATARRSARRSPSEPQRCPKKANYQGKLPDGIVEAGSWGTVTTSSACAPLTRSPEVGRYGAMDAAVVIA
jgi:hypothetical protein